MDRLEVREKAKPLRPSELHTPRLTPPARGTSRASSPLLLSPRAPPRPAGGVQRIPFNAAFCSSVRWRGKATSNLSFIAPFCVPLLFEMGIPSFGMTLT